MRQRKSWEFFPRRFAPPFSEFGRTGSRIRETLMSANAEPRLHKIRLKAREASVSGCSRCKLK
jgi:hypothetical protein